MGLASFRGKLVTVGSIARFDTITLIAKRVDSRH